MGLYKAIEHGKEHRREYRGSKAFDRSCRNHGGCPYCESGRLHKRTAQEKWATEEIREEKRSR